MPPNTDTTATPNPENGFTALRRFLPYLWPKDRPGLRLRVVVAMLLVVAAKIIVLYAPFAYKAVIAGDRLCRRAASAACLFDNLRNAVFERVGQDATRRLAANGVPHLHRLSLRFHLERRTGAVTKVVERGTKSIDTMLYFLLFNIAPTCSSWRWCCGIFWTKFGFGLVAATLVMVAIYIAFTRMVTDWRIALRRR
jgi:hypothetical protein